MSLKCTNLACQAVFPEDEAWVRRFPVRSEFWGQVSTTYECQHACPACGADDPVDCIACDRCHAAEALPTDDYCGPCAILVEGEEQAELEANKRLGIVVPEAA